MASTDAKAQAVRRFNRFYTRQFGLLDNQLVGSPFSLTEARVIFELAHRDGLTASILAPELGLNPGYLSRVLSRLEKHEVLARKPSRLDGRASQLALTRSGRAAFAKLNAASQKQSQDLLTRLPLEHQNRLVQAMNEIEATLAPARGDVVLRDPRPGDFGWVISRHGALYADEFGWSIEFEAMVADIVAKYALKHDPKLEHCWIAERDGAVLGSIFVVRQNASTAKLRLLYVEPSARGLGLGRQLVDECLEFARSAGYKKVILWTNSLLLAARAIYQGVGFVKIAEEPHHSFGQDLVGETWALTLS